MLLNIALIVCAYLLGSIPSAVWIGKKFYGVDVRRHGSKNAGATNTLRVLGRRAALPVFAIDFLKGFVAVKLSLITPYSDIDPQFFYLQMALIIASVVGHIFPIFAGFKGGKGVATVAGGAFAVTTIPLLLTVVTFGVMLILTKYVSLSSMVAAFLYPFYLIFIFHAPIEPVVFGFVVTAALIITHRKNIKRLINGTESKIYIIRRKKKE